MIPVRERVWSDEGWESLVSRRSSGQAGGPKAHLNSRPTEMSVLSLLVNARFEESRLGV